MIIAGATDVGQVREHNEDHFLVGDLDAQQPIDVTAVEWQAAAQRGPLLVICDGMGGVEGGEIASELAAKVMWREMKGTPATRDPEVFARLLRRATRVANHDVHALGRREPGLRGMGTTLSAAGVVADRLVVATVGDSRVYVLRAGSFVQVTRDQSLHSALIAAGHNEDEAASAGGAILQALGVGTDVEPSLSVVELRQGDRVLLCSDGLHGLVGDPALALLLSEPHSVGQAVRLLVAAARAAGGTDNITAIVLEVRGDRLAAPRDDDEDLPRFREFDPQQEGDPALTSTSYVARRLAARIGIPTASIPPSIPVTGQHAVLRSRIGMRVPATALPVELDGPARQRLRQPTWWLYVLVGALACVLAWWLGAR
ncbi:MAG: serine/threonine-protein phosphatase [Deltaproteobacteria bacterium]|nr:serine/threonine-protein phosphatase [Deltaproteobacteria bacterium]